MPATPAQQPEVAREICGAMYRLFNGAKPRTEVTFQDLLRESHCGAQEFISFIGQDPELKELMEITGFISRLPDSFDFVRA